MKLWVLGLAWLTEAGFVGRSTRSGVTYEVQDLLSLMGDRREYRLLRLGNNLEVLIGTDPSYVKTLVVLDVKVGFRHELLKRRGLAHLCEHSLFTDAFEGVSSP